MKRYVIVVVLLVVSMFLVACAPATPEIVVVEKEVPVEKKVVETVVVEKEVPVEKKVVETVIVEKEVPVEKKVVETVVVEKEVVKAGGTLRMPIDPTTPSYYSWHLGLAMDNICANTLTRLVPRTGEPIGDLAKSWDISDDGLIYTFRIHEGVKFHDGQPLTAEDIAWTYLTVADPASQSIWGAYLAGVVGYEEYKDGKANTIAGLRVLDPYTIQFELTKPNAFFPNNLANIYIWPKHILEKVPRKELRDHRFWVEMRIGSGPFKYVKEVPGEYIQFVRFDDYFKGRPHIEQVLLVRGTREAHITALQAGELDGPIGELAPDEVEHLKTFPHITAARAEGGEIPMGLAFKHVKPELELRFRQAVWHAIDRKSILESLFYNQVIMIDSFIPIGPYKHPNLPHIEYDPEKSRQLLKEINWDPNRELYILYYYTQSWAKDLVTAIQSDLAKVGIKSNVRYGDWSIDERDWYLSDTADMELTAQAMFGNPDNMRQALSCDQWYPAGWNGGKYCNPRWDELMKLAATTIDEDKRKEYYYEAQEILQRDVAWAFLFSKPSGIAYNNRVHIKSDGLYIWRSQYDTKLHLWWIEE